MAYFILMSVQILMVQVVMNIPAMKETWIWSLDWEDPLEKGMAPHSSILAWKIPWTEGPDGYSPWIARARYDWATNMHTCKNFAKLACPICNEVWIFSPRNVHTHLGETCLRELVSHGFVFLFFFTWREGKTIKCIMSINKLQE